MKIKTVRIKNFRSFEDESIEFDDYTCLVGANGSGKSNVLHALNVFFRYSGSPGLDPSMLTEEDFYHKNISQSVEIVVTFCDLNESAQQDFAHYFRQGQLVVSAIADYDPSMRRAPVRQSGWRMGIKKFTEYFRAFDEGKPAADLRDIYLHLSKEFPSLPAPARSKEATRQALHDFEDQNQDKCELIPSREEFYGVSRGANRLEKHVQWVYIPAVKEASSEAVEARNTALSMLLARTVRAKIKFEEAIDEIKEAARLKYSDLLNRSQTELKELSDSLARRLIEWAHPDARVKLEWKQDPDKSINVQEPFAQILAGEGKFEGELCRFGHGLQRSYLLALLQELSGCDAPDAPKLILACEEPELFQHPPQARHLYNVLLELSRKNAQVIACTHSPYFVSGEGFESIRLLRRTEGRSGACRAKFDEISGLISDATGKSIVRHSGELALIHQALQPHLSEIFFAPRLILVEGLEDVAYLTTYVKLIDEWEHFRRLGFHFIDTDGKSGMIRPLAMTKAFRIPTYVVFDSDGHKPDKNGSKECHRKDNTAILKLSGITIPDPFPTANTFFDCGAIWSSEIGEVVKSEIGELEWNEFRQKADVHFGQAGGLKKNSLHIALSLKLAWDAGKKSDSLVRACREILRFGESGG